MVGRGPRSAHSYIADRQIGRFSVVENLWLKFGRRCADNSERAKPRRESLSETPIPLEPCMFSIPGQVSRRHRRRPHLEESLTVRAVLTVVVLLAGVLTWLPLGFGGAASAATGPSMSSNGTSLPVVAVQGPSHSLWIYWQAPGGSWIGPAGPGGPGSTFSTPAVAVGPSGLGVVAVQGPSNSLWIYWQVAGGSWIGPAGPGGPGSTYGSPSIAIGASGLPIVAVQGPTNSVWVYWEQSNGQWAGPAGIGAIGTAYSSPSVAIGPSGLPSVAVQGPANSLWIYTQQAGGTWQVAKGVGAIGSTYSSPSMAAGPRGLLEVAVQGPSNSMWVYWQVAPGSWLGPAGPGGPGSTNSAPSIAVSPSGVANVAVQGPGNSLWIYWNVPGVGWFGPAGAGRPGSTFSGPSVAFGSAGLPNAAVVGPSNSLWIFWGQPDGTWVGPAGPGAPGTDNPVVDPGTTNVPPPPQSAVGNSAALIAEGQDGTSDNPASTQFSFDCNPYTAVLYPGTRSSACGTDSYFGVRNASEEWCADFAKLVWVSAGMTSGASMLSPSAASFYAWGAQQGEQLTTDGGSPQVGDAIVFFPPGLAGSSFADHVGLVSAVNPDGTIDIVNGDFLNGSNIVVEQDDNVLPGPYASSIWSPGEQWVYVAP